jgi:hypothetical protein
MIIRVKGSAVAVTAANTVADATLVRIHATNAATITVANAGGTIGTFNMSQYQTEFLEKTDTDTIAATAAVSCTPVAYKG